ncbi:MAG: DinB family protein [Maribacter sp.]|nr:DinB family protein [Maribacter sp.]
MTEQQITERRHFLKASGLLGVGLLMPNINLACSPKTNMDGNIHEFGKREGYTDQVSILVSMMDWMRATVLRSVKGISQKELDFLLDKDSNSIGAMLLHLAATERFYQIDTFTGIPKSSLNFNVDDDEWDAASNLGDKGRATFKKKPLNYYLDKLEEVREYSLNELKQRDDNWLMESTPFFGNQPTNNYCKWFHVVEHESNHNGQIKLIKSRVV